MATDNNLQEIVTNTRRTGESLLELVRLEREAHNRLRVHSQSYCDTCHLDHECDALFDAWDEVDRALEDAKDAYYQAWLTEEEAFRGD